MVSRWSWETRYEESIYFYLLQIDFKGAKAWLADFNHPHYQAARHAIKKGMNSQSWFHLWVSFMISNDLDRVQVWNMEPDFTREGGSIPVTLTFQELTGKNVLLLPIGSSDDGAHSQNEKINISNYIQGVSSCVSSQLVHFVPRIINTTSLFVGQALGNLFRGSR